MLATTVLGLWAKTHQEATGEVLLLPVLHHLMDTAAVALALWDRVLAPADHAAFQAALCLEDASQARAWFAFLIALHDLGKTTPSFQFKYRPQADALRADGFRFPARAVHAFPHDVATERLLPPLLERGAGLTPKLSRRIAAALGAHHGLFKTSSEVLDLSQASLGEREPAWERAREEIVGTLHAVLGLDGVPAPRAESLTNVEVLRLAGITTVADWIASNETFSLSTEPGRRMRPITGGVHASERYAQWSSSCGSLGSLWASR